MTEADLAKLLTDFIATQANFDAWWESDGAKLLLGKWDDFKKDIGWQEIACTVFKLTPDGLIKAVAAIDGIIAQASDADAKGPGRIAFAKAALARPRLLWIASVVLQSQP